MLKMTLAKAEAIDAEEIAKIESESFPEDEAASLDTIRYRLTNARDFFYKATNLNSNEIIGFVNGTCTVADVIQHDSMTNHEPDGRSLVIHSVTVRDVYRRNGVGTSILKEYVRIVAREGRVDRIFLLCKANLLKFYMSCGFNLIGPSAVVHGKVYFSYY